ncbi:MAG: HU family DNA-binding protein [Phycisphaerae bacterium]|nr:HU family DNA-binding protein [Phycisphaerae bacterium]
MNKADLVDAVAAELKTSRADAARAVETILEAIQRGLKTDAKVAIAGFGTFVRRERKARKGINPVTKQPIQIAATTTCGFRPSPQLRDVL